MIAPVGSGVRARTRFTRYGRIGSVSQPWERGAVLMLIPARQNDPSVAHQVRRPIVSDFQHDVNLTMTEVLGDIDDLSSGVGLVERNLSFIGTGLFIRKPVVPK